MHMSPQPPFFRERVYSLRPAGLGVKLSMQGEELIGLEICGSCFLLWTDYYTYWLSDDGQDTGIDGSCHVLTIQFTSWDLPYFT